MEAYVAAAEARGIEEICFTDHIPLPGGVDSAHRMAPEELDGYMREIRRLDAAYPTVRVLSGIEADFISGMEGEVKKILDRHAFDLVLMSVHFVAHWPGDNWVFSFHFPDKSLDQVYGEYLDAVEEGVETGLFDAIAHLDLIKRPGSPLIPGHAAHLKRIFSKAVARGMAMEVNTSGLRKPVGESYPADAIIQLAVTCGLPLITGSDAHDPAQVGWKLDTVTRKLQSDFRARVVGCSGRRFFDVTRDGEID